MGLGLKDSYKNLFESNFCNKIKVGDIVLVKNPAKTRQHWVLGRIIELYPGPDGKVRNVKLLRGDADWDKKGWLKARAALTAVPLSHGAQRHTPSHFSNSPISR